MSAQSYVWGILEARVPPPTGKKLHQAKGQYEFYPFAHEGDLLSIDPALWGKADEGRDVRFTCWPSADQVTAALEGRSDSSWILIATTMSAKAMTIDPTTQVDLQPLPPLPSEFEEVGYDVIDRSGITGLGNIGCTPSDLTEAQPQAISVNVSGLLPDLTVATRFAATMSRVASEHSPFFPVRVLARKRG